MARKRTDEPSVIQITDLPTRRLVEAERLRAGEISSATTGRRLILQALTMRDAERRLGRNRSAA